ncbi:hypothetical protein XI09_33300 [Bradyrhizobium sp. CCBAU 11386]|nr:hypothetical protein [Bradyrhizobium sp. CCBAU 11386]
MRIVDRNVARNLYKGDLMRRAGLDCRKQPIGSAVDREMGWKVRAIDVLLQTFRADLRSHSAKACLSQFLPFQLKLAFTLAESAAHQGLIVGTTEICKLAHVCFMAISEALELQT